MLKKQLANMRILVTRPEPAGKILCDLIRQEGGNSVLLPTIEIAPITRKRSFNFQKLDILIFISPQAVYQSKNLIDKFPPNIQIAAIGSGTQKALKTLGLTATIYPDNDFSSEGLLALQELQNLHHKKIGILKGKGGRQLLYKELTARGAKVYPIIIYQRLLPNIEIKEYLYLLSNNALNMIICTSYDCMKNLKILFKNCFSQIATIPILVVSQRMKVQAEKLGFKKILTAKCADNNALLAALVKEK